VLKKLFCANGTISIFAISVFLLIGRVGVSQQSKPAFRDIRDKISSTTETVALAKVDDLTVTNHLLRSWLEVAKPTEMLRQPIGDILGLPPAKLADVISRLALYEMARRESLRDSDFASTKLVAALRAQRHRILRRRFFEKEIYEKNPPMTDKEARRWYREHIYLYTQPFTFSARAIFLSTYKPYSLHRGDTLQRIARDVIGDPKAIGRILDKATSAPIFTSREEIRFLPPPPPSEGKIVMVPMNADERRSVRERMAKIEKRLRAGEDFVALAKTYSDEPEAKRGSLIGPLPTPGRPLLKSVLEAAKKTPVGQVTPVLETPHGFLILKIVGKTDKPVLPFEKVKARLVADELKQRREAAAKRLIESLFSDPLLEIDRRAFMQDSAPDDLVIARVGDFRYTWGDYRRDTGRLYSAPPTFEARVELLKKSASLREALIEAKARALGLDREPQVAARIRAVEMVLRGRAYLEWYARRKVSVAETRLRQLYLDERERFREPGRYRIRELVIRLDPEDAKDPKKVQATMDYLAELLGRARSEHSFARLARREGNWPPQASKRDDLKWVDEDYRGKDFASKLASLEPGKPAGPFHVGDDVFLVWLHERTPRRYKPFEDVRSEVDRLYRMRHWAELIRAAEKAIRARHKFEILFAYEKL